MSALGSDTSRGDVSVLHVPLGDGSCRLIPESDLGDEEGPLLWTRVHARFELTAADPPAVTYRDGPGLLANPDWASRITSLVLPTVAALSAPGRRQALNAFARLIYDCPPLTFLEPVARALVSVLAEREVAFLDSLGDLATVHQHGSGKREKGTDRIRPPFIAAWEAVESWRLAHGVGGLAADCAAIAAATKGGKSQSLLREEGRLQRAYLRAQKHPSIKAMVLVQLGCPQHGRANHVALMSGQRPFLRRPPDTNLAKAIHYWINIGHAIKSGQGPDGIA